MTIFNSSSAIAKQIIDVVIFEGLELAELGIERASIELDTPLFEQGGLGLDSVDALEILAGVQREFGVVFSDIDDDFISQNSSTVRQLTSTIELYLAKN